MDLWEPRDAQKSVKAPGKKGRLNWAWKTVEGLASQWSEESEVGGTTFTKARRRDRVW